MTRDRLPARREVNAIAFTHAGIEYVGKVSGFENGTVAETFLSPSVKSGTALAHMVAALSVTASIALQHGAPVDELARALPKLEDGSPADPLGKLLDLISIDTQEG